MTDIQIIRVEKASSDINIPIYATQGIAGLDLYSAEEVKVPVGGHTSVRCQYDTVKNLQWYYQYVTVTPHLDPSFNKFLYEYELHILSDTHYFYSTF